jgi:hypothetical protein
VAMQTEVIAETARRASTDNKHGDAYHHPGPAMSPLKFIIQH